MLKDYTYTTLLSNSTRIHLMDFDDFNPVNYLDNLTTQEIERLKSFKHIDRQREFVATRILRHQLFGFQHIHYDIHGAPFIENEGFISISHRKNMVGIAINKAYKIGLDLEPYRETIHAVKHKFLSENEKNKFDIENYKEVTRLWSAKEALYKLAGRKKIIFKTELLLDKNQKGQWFGEIINPDHHLFVKLDIFEHKETIISINSDKIEKR